MGVSSNHVLRPRVLIQPLWPLTCSFFLPPLVAFMVLLWKFLLCFTYRTASTGELWWRNLFVMNLHLSDTATWSSSLCFTTVSTIEFLFWLFIYSRFFFHTILFILCFDFLKVPKNRIYTCGIYAVKYNNNISWYWFWLVKHTPHDDSTKHLLFCMCTWSNLIFDFEKFTYINNRNLI